MYEEKKEKTYTLYEINNYNNRINTLQKKIKTRGFLFLRPTVRTRL